MLKLSWGLFTIKSILIFNNYIRLCVCVIKYLIAAVRLRATFAGAAFLIKIPVISHTYLLEFQKRSQPCLKLCSGIKSEISKGTQTFPIKFSIACVYILTVWQRLICSVLFLKRSFRKSIWSKVDKQMKHKSSLVSNNIFCDIIK